jgi:hypothetical protein
VLLYLSIAIDFFLAALAIFTFTITITNYAYKPFSALAAGPHDGDGAIWALVTSQRPHALETVSTSVLVL